jgi:hypothetical protein
VRGVLGRWWRQRGEVREDMATGCPEKIDLEFLAWVLRFRRDVRPAVVAALAEFAEGRGHVVVLRSRAEVDAWLAAVRSGSAAADDARERPAR